MGEPTHAAGDVVTQLRKIMDDTTMGWQPDATMNVCATCLTRWPIDRHCPVCPYCRPVPHHTDGPFEHLRKFAAKAVEQLIVELVEKQQTYNVPANDVLALMKAVARVRHESTWDVWESWALRHAIPIHEVISQLAGNDPAPWERQLLEKRLQDALGYAILGLVMATEP